MRLLTVLTTFFQVLVVKSLHEVSGYIGGNVVLPSGADPSWTLLRIEWSIFINNTWIATYRSQTTNVDRLNQYKGRLTLNQTSGDLMIRNLRQGDGMDYTVGLLSTENDNKVNKIRLKVKQPLQKPTIKQIHNAATENGCFMFLNCSSQDQDVDFSWKVMPHCLSSGINTKGSPSQLLVHISTQDPVEFTCTSHTEKENISNVVKFQCNVVGKEPSSRDRCGIGISCSIASFVVLITLIYCSRGHLIAVWHNLRGRLCPSKD